MTLEEFVELFRGVDAFPRLMLMEYVEGPEHTVDALVDGGELVLHQTKTRERVETGVAMAFRTVERPDLVDATRHACRAFGLDWFVNVAVHRRPRCSRSTRASRRSSTRRTSSCRTSASSTRSASSTARAAAAQARVRTSRRTIRYYDQVFWDV
jgi:hypothetical protein